MLWAGIVAYLSAAAVVMWPVWDCLLTPFESYRPTLTWTVEATNALRLAALRDAGETAAAYCYHRLTVFSACLIGFAIILGLIGSFLPGSRQVPDPIRLMILTIVSILAYSAFSNGAVIAAYLWTSGAVATNVGGMPALWFLSTAASTVSIAWTAALLLHAVMLLLHAQRPLSRIPFY